ncbi:MAG: hypothetical protein JW753_05135 [Dehalococcoidia bacterium]|nr:hypothetical protein [Dehalococcoidia bacterium]
MPKFFHLYRLAGAAVLREPTIQIPPHHISPNINDLEDGIVDNTSCIMYRGESISRSVRVPVPYEDITGLQFKMEDVPFMDGVVDILKLEDAVIQSPEQLASVRYEGMTEEDMGMLRIAISVLGRRHYEDYYSNDPVVFARSAELRKYLATSWDFGQIGH